MFHPVLRRYGIFIYGSVIRFYEILQLFRLCQYFGEFDDLSSPVAYGSDTES